MQSVGVYSVLCSSDPGIENANQMDVIATVASGCRDNSVIIPSPFVPQRLAWEVDWQQCFVGCVDTYAHCVLVW